MAFSQDVFFANLNSAWRGFFLPALVFIKDSAMLLIISPSSLSRELMLKILIISALTIGLYKPARKMIDRPFIAFLASLIAAILGIAFIPPAWLSTLMVPWAVAIIVGIMLVFTLIFKMAWWLRKTAIGAVMIASGYIWYFYGRENAYLAIIILCLLLFIMDKPIHKLIAPLRGKSNEAKELGAKVKIKQKEINDAMMARATTAEIKALEKELKDLIKKKSEI